LGNLKTILGFGWKYLRPYWRRLEMAILLSCVCGLTAGAFIWATNTFAKRMQGPAAAAETQAAKQKSKESKESFFSGFEARTKQWQKSMESTLDPWLPRNGVRLNMQQVMGGLLLLPLIALLRGGTDYLSNYCMNWVSERVINDLRCEVMGKLTSLSLDYFNRSTTGDMLTRINVDTVNLHRALRQAGADVFKESFTMLAALVGLWWVDWKLALFLGVLLPLIALPLFILGRKARRAGREGRRANVGQSSLLVEALSGIRVLKAFNLEARQTERFRDFSKKLVHHSMKGVQAKEMANPIIEVIAAVGVSAIIVYLFWSGQSPADLFTLISALLFFLLP
jgi:ATP-binding cassette, subfamily B, bacterial MsbA